MFCGSATGVMLPPMVVYKAQGLYECWCERGPKGTVYACSKSGWFDMYLFEKWFEDLLLPKLKRKTGKKLIVGDNLASHISPRVIELCRANDIVFVCLPPNSTDKLQPLDVGVFAPMKAAWRRVLTEYKENHPKQAGVPKTDFPRLLKKLMDTANPGQHLPAAFEKCGLYPINAAKGIERIPSRDMYNDSETIRANLNATFGERLERLRGVEPKEKKKRGKKLKVAPGKTYTAPDSEEEDSEEEDSEEEREVESSEEEMDVDELLGDGDGGERRIARQADTSEEEEEEEVDDMDDVDVPKAPPLYAVGSYVAAVYDREWYVAQVEGEEPENECPGFTLLKYMERKGNNQFVWGSGKDTLKTINRDILRKVDPPIPVSSRLWGLSKEDAKDVDRLLRVQWSIIVLLLNLLEYQTYLTEGGGAKRLAFLLFLYE